MYTYIFILPKINDRSLNSLISEISVHLDFVGFSGHQQLRAEICLLLEICIFGSKPKFLILWKLSWREYL